MTLTVIHSMIKSCNTKPGGRSKSEKLSPSSQTVDLFYLQHIIGSMRCVYSGPVRSCAPLTINQKLDLILALHSSFISAKRVWEGGECGVGVQPGRGLPCECRVVDGEKDRDGGNSAALSGIDVHGHEWC